MLLIRGGSIFRSVTQAFTWVQRLGFGWESGTGTLGSRSWVESHAGFTLQGETSKSLGTIHCQVHCGEWIHVPLGRQRVAKWRQFRGGGGGESPRLGVQDKLEERRSLLS